MISGSRPEFRKGSFAPSGWGGFTAERAVYPFIYADSTEPQTLTLKDVPAGAFWSVTVYDADGYPQGESYNINSEWDMPELKLVD